MKIIQVKDNQSVPMNLFLFVKERGIFRTRATLQAPRPYLQKEIVQMQPRRHISSNDSCSSDDSENSQEYAIIETPEKRKCPGPVNDDRQTCALPEDGLQMDPNDSGDPCFGRVCEEEFSDIADDRYESPDSAPGSVCSSECSSEEMISEDIGNDSEPDDSPKNERESSIYPSSTFTNGNFDALFLAFLKKHHISESAKEYLLKLLQLTLSDADNTATSSYTFNKRHRDCSLSYSRIELCLKCHKKVEKELRNNDDCEDKGMKIDPLRFFVLPLKPQTQRLIQGRKPTISVFLFGFRFSF